ncbi:hypothetical protein SpCBS45565_g08409 [Spizellomyces sp. 'palustris']|nr:hypothetical protein SpCBS45565_g08409 [Spizellomyces sp. 'palustris']
MRDKSSRLDTVNLEKSAFRRLFRKTCERKSGSLVDLRDALLHTLTMDSQIKFHHVLSDGSLIPSIAAMPDEIYHHLLRAAVAEGNLFQVKRFITRKKLPLRCPDPLNGW